jgi:hypothetical protein
MQLYDNLADIMKLINGDNFSKSPLVVKTKSQGFRPHSAVNRHFNNSAKIRPVSGKPTSFAVRGFQL